MIYCQEIQKQDTPFLWEVLYQAVNFQQNQSTISKETIQQTLPLAKDAKNWGQEGDFGLLAIESQTNQPVGATWFRQFTLDNQGYGYINDQTPEISLAILLEYPYQGLGTQLLIQLLTQAKAKGCPALSLSVHPQNVMAIHLYQKLGFQKVGSVEGSWVMKRELM